MEFSNTKLQTHMQSICSDQVTFHMALNPSYSVNEKQVIHEIQIAFVNLVGELADLFTTLNFE